MYMGIKNMRFSFGLDRSRPEAILEQLENALRMKLERGQEPLRYAIVSVSGGRAVVEASVLDRKGVV